MAVGSLSTLKAYGGPGSKSSLQPTVVIFSVLFQLYCVNAVTFSLQL